MGAKKKAAPGGGQCVCARQQGSVSGLQGGQGARAAWQGAWRSARAHDAAQRKRGRGVRAAGHGRAGARRQGEHAAWQRGRAARGAGCKGSVAGCMALSQGARRRVLVHTPRSYACTQPPVLTAPCVHARTKKKLLRCIHHTKITYSLNKHFHLRAWPMPCRVGFALGCSGQRAPAGRRISNKMDGPCQWHLI